MNKSHCSNAVIYARVSSKEQEREGYSIPSQVGLLREYAKKNGFKVMKEFTDAETAKSIGRKNFNLMLSFLEETPEVKTILVEKTDRLYRNFKDYVLLDDLELDIHLVKENEVLCKDSRSHQKFIHGVKVLMAKNYIDNLREEVKKGMLEKAKSGHFPSRAPVGYVNDPVTRHIKPDPEKAPLVRLMFELYATGEHSLRTVRDKVVEEGFHARKKRKYFSPSLIDRILSNPVYKGDFTWEGELWPGKHEPLVSCELWDRVQKVKHDKQRRPQTEKPKFAYTGMLRCSICGCSIVAESKKGGRYIYYHCSGSRGKCSQPYIREDRLEEAMASIVQAISFDEERLEWIKEALKGSNADKLEWQKKQVSKLQKEQTRLSMNLHTLYEDRLDGTVTKEFYVEKSRDLRDRLGKVEEKLKAHTSADGEYLDQGIRILELANSAYNQWVMRDSFEKAKLLKILCSNLVLDHKSVLPEYRQPFDLIAKASQIESAKKAAGAENLSPRSFWCSQGDSNPCFRIESPAS